MEQLAKAWRQRQHVQGVHTVGHQLAEASTAEVQQGGAGGAGSDHLHAALRRCGARHRVELLILQLRRSNTCQENGDKAYIWLRFQGLKLAKNTHSTDVCVHWYVSFICSIREQGQFGLTFKYSMYEYFLNITERKNIM